MRHDRSSDNRLWLFAQQPYYLIDFWFSYDYQHTDGKLTTDHITTHLTN